MAAKKKPTLTKTAKATPVKVVPPTKSKLSNKAKKAPAKKTKKPRKPKAPKITDAQFEAWFFKQDYKKFVQLAEDWNELKLKIKIPKLQTYDAALNYFKTLSPDVVQMLGKTGKATISSEAYAALSRWADIINNPSRIDKIHRAGLTTGKTEKSIVDYAKDNDRLGVLEAIRDELASKLQQGAGARDAGQLSAQMMEVMTQIDIQKRKLAPKQETTLGSLLSDIPGKRPSKNGGGARHTSYTSKIPVTIEDLEKTK